MSEKCYPAVFIIDFPVVDIIWHSLPTSLLLLSLSSLEKLSIFFHTLSCSVGKMYVSALVNKLGAESCSKFIGTLPFILKRSKV